ncbi:MAG: hypothetical protein RIS76_1656 [Verrucomicrobiota bacterium]|jgi:tetratricopeptide (TPR) repeat protein
MKDISNRALGGVVTNAGGRCQGVPRWWGILGWLLFSSVFGISWAHGPQHEQILEIDAQIARQPDNAELLLRRADLYRLDDDEDRALADLDAAEKLRPSLEGIGWVRARVFLNRAQPAAALPHLNRWLEIHPRHGSALTARALAREQTGDPAGAVEDYSRAIGATQTPTPDLFLARARAQRRVGPEFFREALRGLDEGITQTGSLVVLQMEAMNLEMALGRTEEALSRLDNLLRNAARKESWYARRAEFLEQAQRQPEAREAWQQTLKACLVLPSRLRQARSTQALETRAREHLSGKEIAQAETAAVAAQANNGSETTDTIPLSNSTRTAPAHASLKPQP